MKFLIIRYFICVCLLVSALTLGAQASWAQVRIAEFRPSTKTQYVELQNEGDTPVDLRGWSIYYGDATRFAQFHQHLTLSTGSCILIATKHLVLPTTTGIHLISPEKKEVDSASFTTELIEGYSFHLFGSAYIMAAQQSLGRDNQSGALCASAPPTPTEANLTPTPTSQASLSPSPTPTTKQSPTPTVEATPTPTSTPSMTPTQSPTPRLTTTPTPTTSTTPTPSQTPYISNIILSEVMVAPHSPNPEWVELYNPSNKPLTLTNWHIDDVAGGGSVPQQFSATVPALGYWVVELNSAIFNNSGDSIRILDEQSAVVAETNYTSSFPDSTWSLNTTTQSFCHQVATYARANTNECIHTPSTPTPTPQPTTSAIPTPSIKTTPTPAPITPTPKPSTTPTPTAIPTVMPTATPTPTTTSHNDIQNIYISEFMPRPTSGEAEWVEIYNANDHVVTLSGWYIDDVEGAGSTPKRMTDLTIDPYGYATYQLSSAIFNNDADDVRLLNASLEQVDALHYNNAVENQSFSRNTMDTPAICLTNATYDAPNEPCIVDVASTSSLQIEPTVPTSPSPTQEAPSQSAHSSDTRPSSQLWDGQVAGTSSTVDLPQTTPPTLRANVTPQHHTPRLVLTLSSLAASTVTLILILMKYKPW